MKNLKETRAKWLLIASATSLKLCSVVGSDQLVTILISAEIQLTCNFDQKVYEVRFTIMIETKITRCSMLAIDHGQLLVLS